MTWTVTIYRTSNGDWGALIPCEGAASHAGAGKTAGAAVEAALFAQARAILEHVTPVAV